MRKYSCPRIYKTHNGPAFMISMNESKIYKRVHVTVCILALFFGNNNGGIMSFTKTLCEGYKNKN